jgi:hypothetical protein
MIERAEILGKETDAWRRYGRERSLPTSFVPFGDTGAKAEANRKVPETRLR